ncbi:leucine-rich repeat and transmembrane domain-containing protein 1-like [Elgaria multicarinata webbii]|uniref:leucine-rich repeat and transmembrane domain-containing protein 1-like n=1 Tax=Elgaria multicarinata webbii TaxID=159646 RepID=UPI002FCD311B
MGQDRAGHKRWTVLLFVGFLLATELALGALEESCNCSTPINSQELQTNLIPGMCCLNFTRTKIDTLDWSIFAGIAGLRELYLSNCSISDIINVDNGSSTLEILHLDHNQLSWLPDHFLRNAPSLHVIQLDSNQLQKLPKSFLETSDQIQEIHLDFNNLSSLPSGIFKPSLLTLSLSNNSWDCTCSLLGDLEKYLVAPFYTDVVCNTPERFHGLNIKTIPKQELCRIPSLTALFICLPLVAVLVLVTWCFCKQKKKTTGYALRGGKECRLATVERNGAKGSGDHHCYIPYELPLTSTAESEKNILLQNQVLLKPSTALLGSNRDLYEEVEIKLGASEDSLLRDNEGNLDQDKSGSKNLAIAAEGGTGGESEAETMSVTDVLKDSADREKLYMNQSADYYNLVPGIELEDSDHMEYENVNLS